MSTIKAHALALAALLAPLAFVAPAAAQAEDNDFDKSTDDVLSADQQTKDEAKEGDKMPGEKDKAPEPEPPSDMFDTFEKDGQRYNFVGARFRNLIVPQFMINLFADGGATVNVFTIGPEFSTRKDGLEIDLALSYADYSMDEFLFKGATDDDDAWEIVGSDMKLLYFTADLLYEIPLDKEKGRFSVLIGGGVGLGIVFGDLRRSQAYPNDPNNLNTDDVTQWNKCPGANAAFGADPGTGNAFCDDSNDHFKPPNDEEYNEASWANGGSKPSVFPWISLPQISFRYKPMKHLQARLDTGFSISGFFIGASAGYGL